MATSDEIKRKALELSEKTDSNSISPKEVGGIMHDLASLGENAIRNGGTLGIRKVYTSVSVMEADKNPKDFWGNPMKKGNIVLIYDGTTTGLDNNKIYVYMNPGWEFATYLDAGYPTRQEFSELGSVVEANKTDLTKKIDNNKKDTDEKISELGSEASKIKYRERLLFKRESPNLINIETLIANVAISGNGTLYNVTNGKDYITEYIHVYKGVSYVLSGGYTSTRYSLFENIGDTVNPISYGKITENSPFVPSKEGFIVLQVRDSAILAETYTTAQFEEGEVATPYKIYSPIVYRIIDERFLPSNIVKYGENGKIKSEDLDGNVMLEDKYIGEERESPNLIDLDAVIPNRAISAVGTIYNTSTDANTITDWIPVRADTPYIISGGYSNTIFALYKNYGDVAEPIQYGKIPLNTAFYFDADGYVVLQLKDSAIAAVVWQTTQFEEGEVATPYKPYSPVIHSFVKKKHLPSDIYYTEDGKVKTEDLDKPLLIEKSDSTNLIIIEKAQYNTAMSAAGALYTTSSYNVMSDWIPVKEGVTYYLSGGYAENQVALYANYGDKSNPIAFNKINGWDGATYTPIADGYVVLEMADSSSATADRSSTIQFEEGTVATPYSKGGKMKEYFNPVYMEKESTNLFDDIAKSELVGARIVYDTKEIVAEAGNYCTPKLPVPNSDYIYVSGLGNSSSERVCLFYDGDTVNYWKFKTYGDSFKIPINGACSHFVLWFKASDESLDLKNVYIGGLPATYKEGVCTDTFKQVFEHKNEVVIPLDVDNDLGEIVVTSDNNLDNVLIPVHVHYSSKPRYAVDRFDHVYIGSEHAGLKEDISFSLDGEILRSRRFGGNYTFVPTSNSRFLYFNAQFTHNGVSKIIGSYNGDNGVFVKDDINSEWVELIPSAKFGYIDSGLDIYYKKGKELYCANIDNISSPKLIYTSSSSSFFVDFDCFTETDDYVFFGTYQNEWDTKVIRIKKSDKTTKICFDTAQKQHVHKILAIDNVIYLCCDGATANNANFDEYPTYLTKGMGTFKSSDFGETWETIKYPWSGDYGVIGYYNGWFYGSAEASIKYAPSLFRSKDLRTWEIVENMPATAGGTFRVCDKGFIQSSMSSGFLTHNVIKFSADGKKFVPVFDKRVVSSAISTGLKPTHNYNNTIVIDGNKCVLLNDQSKTLENAYIFNEIGYTVFAYIQADLKAGENIIKIHKGGCIKDIEPSKSYMPSHVIMTSADMLVDESMEGVSINSVAVPSNIDGFSIPYKLEKQHGIMADVDVKKNANIHVGTLAFSIKEFSYFEGKPYLLLDFGTLKIYRNKSKLQLMEYGKIAAECVLGSMGYYSNVSSRVHITFDDNIKVYVNGKLNSTTSNNTDFPRGITQVSIKNADSNDFVSNICLYASAMTELQVIRDFEGFNLI